jgi:DNA-binding MarR family transcriptional regulator
MPVKRAKYTAAQGAEMLRLDRQVCFPLYAATNLLNRIYRPLLAEFGLTYPQYLTMLVLWETQPQSVGELGAKLHLDSGTLTPLLKRLEAEGLVVRRRDAADERRVLVALTPAGLKMRDKITAVPESLGAKLNLSAEMLDALRERVQGLVAILTGHLNAPAREAG